MTYIAIIFLWEAINGVNRIKRITKGKAWDWSYISTVIIEEPVPKYYSSMNPSAFLEWERKSDAKHEYASGMIISMTGTSPGHNLILSNIIAIAGSFLKEKSCNIYPGDLRIYVPSRESYFYPDASIICGSLDLWDDI